MAFETIRGESGVDFIGTDGVDILFSLNETGSILVDAKGGDDNIQLADSSNVIGTVTVKGGDGNDTISATDPDTGNNEPARFSDADVKGGAGNDIILSAGAVSSVLRGNEGDDDFTLSGNYTASTVNGNSGEDSFDLATDVTFENTKVLGGSGNDGLLNFTGSDIAAAVNSTINGSKGVDFIQIGEVLTASAFSVFGGQDADTITSANNTADGVTYSGDLGNDTIRINGGANATVLGGEGDDRVIVAGAGDNSIDLGVGSDTYTDGNGASTVVAGDGADNITDADGADTYTLGEGDDTYADNAGADTVNGGAGEDTYDFTATGAGEVDTFVISSISDSAATTTGVEAAQAFDTFGGGLVGADTVVDITAFADTLAGNTVTAGAELAAFGARIDIALTEDDFSFAELADGLTGNLSASTGNGSIGTNRVEVTDADGNTTFYVILNNSNDILDSGDVMFEVDARNQFNQLFTAIEAGF